MALTHEEAVEQMHDISPLDISLWEVWLAWLLYGLGVLLAVIVPIMVGAWLWRWWHRRRELGWRERMVARLDRLRNNTHSDKVLAQEISTLLKYSAIHFFGRESAGLSGQAWLEWLDKHPPEEGAFEANWQHRAQLLLTLPYAPEGSAGHERELHRLIDLTQEWIDAHSAARLPKPGLGHRLPVIGQWLGGQHG